MTYKFADVSNVKMHYDLQGKGEALVLIHAGIANLTMWDAQASAFKPHFRVLRYDVRGFGETPDPPGKYTDHEDLKALLDGLGIQRASVVGISNGGRIALDFALTYPEVVNKLVMIAPGLAGYKAPRDDWSEDMFAREEEATAAGELVAAAEIVARIWVDGPQRSPEQVEPEFRKRALALIRHTLGLGIGPGEGDIARPPAAGRLSEVKVPTLLIIGTEDLPEMQDISVQIGKGIENIRRVEMEGTAHLPPMEKPEEFNRIVLDFLLS